MRKDRRCLFITYIFDMVLPEKYNHIHKRFFFSIFTNIQHKNCVLEAKLSARFVSSEHGGNSSET